VESIVITGASSGIGYDAARHAIAQGARVFGSVRSDEDGARVRAALGEHFVPLRFDVTDDAAVRAGADQVRGELAGARLFGLVNNAGVATPGPLLHQPVEEWRHVIEINLVGAMRVTQAFAPLLFGAGGERPGRIINISSISGRIGWPMLSAYAASKHGLEGLSDALRRELLIHGVDVIVIGPGSVKTPIWDKARRHDVSRYDGTPYGALFKRYDAYLGESEQRGIPVEHISGLVWHVLTTARPRVRYAPAPDPFTNWLLPFLPKRLVDRIAARVLGLTRRTP
jgi:NAD(P)-dependent dehydrogenase (short-subunit alcohol dehydrogenase family)